MRNRFQKFAVVIVTVMLAVICSFSSFAAEEKDYSMGDAWWEIDNPGVAMGKWDKCESSTSYKVQLYRGSKVVLDWKTATGGSQDFTSTIVKNGTGNYVFRVYPVKGNKEDMVSSDVLEVDSEVLSEYKKAQKEIEKQQAYEEASDGWHSYPMNTWTYGKGNHTLARNEWMTIDGATYFFDTDAHMVTGWKRFGNAYYYFDQTSGALWRNATTPDGYYVNGDGIWVDASGNVAQTNVTKDTGSVNVNIQESGADGTIRNAVVTGVSNAQLVSWSFSSDHSQWQIGYPVSLTVVIRPNSGAQFTSKTKYTVNNGTVQSVTGSDPLTITATYYPRMKLEAPKNVYMGDDSLVKWTAVNHAKAYQVRIYDGTSHEKTLSVSSTYCDLSGYSDEDEFSDINVSITATGGSGSMAKYYLTSDPAKLGSISTVFINDSGVGGTFKRSTAGLSYTDEYGDRVTGWQEIGGYWYFFDKNHLAKVDWYQDADGFWYYFDGESRMCTGNINDGTGTYFMNDGSIASVPYGAWVQ